MTTDKLILSDRDWNDFRVQERIKMDFSNLKEITDKWGYIRQAYLEQMPSIMQASRKRSRANIDPYFIDWMHHLSPIEEDAWHSIRSRGVPLYPQFPLFNYFIDFANPYHRIGLELDGKNWHDEEKDKKRDLFLSQYGWKIFRIKGKETKIPYKTPVEIHEANIDQEEEILEIENWLLNTCDGVITSIDYVYFLNEPDKYGGLYVVKTFWTNCFLN